MAKKEAAANQSNQKIFWLFLVSWQFKAKNKPFIKITKPNEALRPWIYKISSKNSFPEVSKFLKSLVLYFFKMIVQVLTKQVNS